MSFFKKRTFSTMFFSERLECSSFDKLKRNFSKNSRKKVCSIFGICKNNVFCLEQSSQFSSGHQKRSFDNAAETFGESLKIFNAKFGKQWMKDFFQDKFPDIFSSGGLECNLTRLLRKSCQKSQKFFHYLKLFFCLFTYFFDLWFNWSWKLPLKKLIWTRKL